MLCGKVSPSGKLPATVARAYEDFPSAADFGNKEYNNYTEDIYVGYRYFETFSKNRVLYPFGFGLTYGEFETKFVSAKEKEDGFELTVEVKNKGEHASAYAPQIYVEKPCGVLGNPYRELLCIFMHLFTGVFKVPLPQERLHIFTGQPVLRKSAAPETGIYGFFLWSG